MTRLRILTLAFAATLLPLQASADPLTEIIQTDLQTLGYDTGGTDGEMTVPTAIAISKFQAENSFEVTGEASPQLAGTIKAALKNDGRLPPQAQPSTAANAAVPPAAPAQEAPPAETPSAFSAIAGAVAPSMMQGMLSGATGIDPAMLQMATGGQSQQNTAIDPETMQALQMQMAQMMGGATGVDPAVIQAAQMEAMQQQATQAQQACLEQKIAEAQAAQESAQRRRGFGSLMRAVTRLGGNDVAVSVAEATADIANANAVITDLESAARDLGLTEEDVQSCQAT